MTKTSGSQKTAIRYIESSALVAAVIENDAAAKASIRAAGLRFTSTLTVAEASRAILRAGLSGRITPKQQTGALLTIRRFTLRCHMIDITESILSQAGRAFPLEPIRTLDAIHLATAAEIEETPSLITVVTRDHRVRTNAIALGHSVE